ncbi:MAG: O-antigen polysaccharide polymerase Wzy [Lachnospiraceae bacterium]|nr:O-antigen polysaccharide polymerase Wzy [Lachnospiraceae bacterium]
MKANIRKDLITGILLLCAVITEVFLIIWNIFALSDQINYVMYVLNYIVGGLIIINLMMKGITEHFLAFAFFCTYMLFLMAQKPFEKYYNVYLTFVRVELDTRQYFCFSCILFLGLSLTYYAYCFWSQRSRCLLKTDGELSLEDFQYLKPVLGILLSITLPCAVYMQGYIVMIRGSMEYTEGYLINVDIPAPIKVGYYVYTTVVLLYLALKPRPWQMVTVLSTYLLIEGGFQLLQGRRALFACTVLFVAWYLIKYYEINRISFKFVISLGFIFILLLALFILVEQSRDNAETRLSFDMIRRFLISTGGSDSVIANTIFRKNDFPESGITYLLDPFVNNPLVNILLGKTSTAQGMAYLEQHHSFAHWISYMTESSLYLSGHGMGSSYLAETYLAFGIPGIVISSLLLGWVINGINRLTFTENIYRNAFIFYMVRRLFTLPRDGAFSWVDGLLYMLFSFILLYPFYARFCWQQTEYRRGERENNGARFKV